MIRSVGGHLRPEWMTRDLQLLILARSFMSATRALAGVVVPIYLAKLGFSATTLGILFAVTAIVSAILTGLIGFLSDRVGRKVFIIGVPLLAACAGLVFALTQNEAVVFFFAAIGSFGRGAGAGGGSIGPYQPAEQSYLADSVPPGARTSLFGRIAFASSLGAVIGVGVLAWIPDVAQYLGVGELNAYRPAFIALSLMAFTAAMLPLPIAPRHAAASARKASFSLPRRSWPVLLRLWLSNSINGLAVGFFGPFITYWFYRRFHTGPGTVGTLYAIINLGSMVSNLSAAPAARRLGLVRAIVAARSIAAVLIVPMVLSPHFWMAGTVYFIRMMIQRLGLPMRQSYVMGVVADDERAVVAGLSTLPSQATSAASPVAAGYLFEHVAMAVPFELGAILQGANSVVFWLCFRNLRPPEEGIEEISSPEVAVARSTGADAAGR